MIMYSPYLCMVVQLYQIEYAFENPIILRDTFTWNRGNSKANILERDRFLHTQIVCFLLHNICTFAAFYRSRSKANLEKPHSSKLSRR